MRLLSFEVPEEDAGLAIAQFLRNRGCSHRILMQLKGTAEGILRNGQPVFTNQRLAPGDVLSIRLEEACASDSILPVALPLTIVYEDEDLLVIDKPADMPVHPSPGNHDNTLANAMAHHLGQPFVFRCINRLDRDTSGLLIVARHALSAAILSSQLLTRSLRREYLAIAEGILPEAVTVREPIARVPGSVLARCVDPNGESAVTHVTRLAIYNRKKPDPVLPEVVSLARVRLETGRTHQIRVHLTHLGHPLPGDFLYHPASVCAAAPRQMLHSHTLRFPHPITGEELFFESPLPADMQRFLSHYE